MPGTAITYTITVTNAGPSSANGFSIADTVPAAITGVTATLCGHRHGQLRPERLLGQRRQLHRCERRAGRGQRDHAHGERHVSPDATGDLTNTATATAGAGSTDANTGNNSATDTDTPGVSQVDLAIAKTDGQTAYVPGTPISYTITVTNEGPSTATGVTIADPVPAAITGVAATCTATRRRTAAAPTPRPATA